jgi:hypothetical protein
MVERHVKPVEEHLKTVDLAHQIHWDERLPIFLLPYRSSTHDTTGTTPASVVFGMELCLPCELLFGAVPDQEQSTTDNVVDLVDRLRDIHPPLQHLKAASDRVKARYDHLANSTGYQEEQIWLYRPTRNGGKSPEQQTSWKAHTMSSRGSTTWSTGSSVIIGRI